MSVGLLVMLSGLGIVAVASWWWWRRRVRASTPLERRVERFLASRSIAVVGVSDQRETGCNLAFSRFVAAGYEVWPVNPRIERYDGRRCYPDLRSLPRAPDAVFVFTRPEITDDIVAQCVEVGVRHVWMHCMAGVKPGLAAKITSVSAEAVEACRTHGIEVIAGSCPNQFLAPDFAHRMLRGISRGLGYLEVSESPQPPAARATDPA